MVHTVESKNNGSLVEGMALKCNFRYILIGIWQQIVNLGVVASHANRTF